MCGICGIVNKLDSRSVSEALLSEMRDTLRQRGPDDAGSYFHTGPHSQVALGHRRLSIIDLSTAGHQPMSTADGKWWIVFNGEIFNFRELRAELIAAGHSFRSQTDTEVILYGVVEWGLFGCLERLRGMYAFALYNSEDQSISLVRDPLGVKPLYYFADRHTLAFASEIKALLCLPFVSRDVDADALYDYLTFSNSPGPATLFRGIRKLPPGTVLRWDHTLRATKQRFWDAAQFAPQDRIDDEAATVEQLRELLRRSVARRMVSDVPFGVFLSGGVDSSLNVALMAEKMDRPVETFSIGIRDDEMNEFHYARQVAKRFATQHHELIIDENDFLKLLPELPYLQDEPLADPVCIPIYYISKLAREAGVPVIQVGEGSDEIFAGYGNYHLFNGWRHAVFETYRHFPRWIKSSTQRLMANRLAPEWQDAFRRARDNESFFVGNAIAFWDAEKTRLLKSSAAHAPSSALIQSYLDPLSLSDPLARLTNIELRNRLPELLLMRVDKMSMANSIETRVPFLDEDVVEFALRLPSSLKFKDGHAKYILKKAAEGIIPNDIIYRKKIGFCGSATNMLKGRVADYAREVISQSNLIAELFNRDYIDTIFNRARQHARFNNFKIWNLMNLALWDRRWFN